MRLGVPFYHQEKSNSCGLAVFRMVLGYFGVEIPEKELGKKVEQHRFGVFTTDMAVAANELGFTAKAFTFHLSLFGPLGIPFGSKITREMFKKMKVRKSDVVTKKTISDYVKAGGELVWDYPRVERLEKWLKEKVPVIISVNTTALNRYWKHWNNGHYLIVEGVTGKEVEVVDPDMPETEARYTISKELLLPAWSINAKHASDFMMAIYRKG
jgi:ABC-type bacteriocin/lantibiotic exporter with double-glycine peptidase domain